MKKRVRILGFCMALVMLFGMIPFAVSATQADTIALNDTKDVSIDEAGKLVDFYFTPAETGHYVFWSTDNTIDTYGHIYNGETEVKRDDDGGDDNNFKVEAELTAGVQYTLRARAYSSGATGTMKVHVAKLVAPTQMEAFNGQATYTINLGNTLYIQPEYAPENSYEEDIALVSSNTKVAMVYGEQIIAVGAGTATITATSESRLKDSMKLTVTKPVTIKAGNTFEVSPYNTPAPTYKFVATETANYNFYVQGDAEYSFYILDQDFEYVGNGKYFGNTRIQTFAATKGVTYYIVMSHYPYGENYTVGLAKTTAGGGLKAEYSEYIGALGNWVYPEVIPAPLTSDVTEDDITYTSSNPEIVEVDGTSLKCKAVGSATITATNAAGASTTFKVTVPQPQKITKTGRYTATCKANQEYITYEFVPATSGRYYIGKLLNGGGGAYIPGMSSDGNYYQLTGGEAYYIRAYGYDNEATHFYVLAEGDESCLTKGHKFVSAMGLAPTTLTEGALVKICTVCGEEGYTYTEQLTATKDASKQFKDVKKKNWFYDAVNFAYNSNLFAGTSKTEFSPNDNMTRGMFVTVLGRLSGVTVNNKVTTKFKDVAKGQYYTGYVKWASEAGIVSGTSKTAFEPNANITREQICTIMVRYLDAIELGLRNDTPVIKFKDEAKISKWAKDAVLGCQKGGIVNGQKDGNGYIFNPQGNATRAEVATIIYNYVQNYLVTIFSTMNSMGGM